MGGRGENKDGGREGRRGGGGEGRRREEGIGGRGVCERGERCEGAKWGTARRRKGNTDTL